MLLDIKNFAQNQRERQSLLNQEADLAFKQLCKTIEDIPTTEFDKFFNPKLKKEIEHYYQDIEYYHQHATYNKPKATLEIDITKESLIGIYKKVNDNTSAIDYWDARRKADNVMYSMDIANEIIIDGLTKRLSDYLKSADENLIIKTGNQTLMKTLSLKPEIKLSLTIEAVIAWLSNTPQPNCRKLLQSKD